MYEATFRIPASQAYAAATERADGSIELWCNDHCDLLYVSEPVGEDVLARVRDAVGVQEHAVRGGEHVIVTADCLRTHTASDVDSYLREHDCLLRPPLRYENGVKVCRILAVDPDSLTALYRDLAEEFVVDVDAKREVAHPTTWEPRHGGGGGALSLTDRQRDVLTAAHEAGYYRIPRETTTADLAERFELDRRTVEEHLRRAENKLVSDFLESPNGGG